MEAAGLAEVTGIPDRAIPHQVLLRGQGVLEAQQPLLDGRKFHPLLPAPCGLGKGEISFPKVFQYLSILHLPRNDVFSVAASPGMESLTLGLLSPLLLPLQGLGGISSALGWSWGLHPGS